MIMMADGCRHAELEGAGIDGDQVEVEQGVDVGP